MDIPDAGSPEAEAEPNPSNQIPPLVIGEPFAMAEGLELVDEHVGVHPGCTAIVRCEGAEGAPCGQIFKIPLLHEGVKTCPKCARRFTHVLIIAPDDDDDIVADAMELILRANGIDVPGSGDDEGDEEPDDE
jgi:hypothetical protein